MAFIIENDTVISFADFQDVLDKDQRLFQANEGLSDDIVEQHLVRATERILDRFRSSSWWREYYLNRATVSIRTVADIPALDPNLIKDRQNDFADLCVYTALADYILPSVADFGQEDSSERQKMGYYANKAESLFGELITAGDWYDFANDGQVTSAEKQPGQFNPKRIR